MFDQKFSVQLIKRYYKILRYYHHDDKEDELGKNKYSDSISSLRRQITVRSRTIFGVAKENILYS